jgi:hypothetical protein
MFITCVYIYIYTFLLQTTDFCNYISLETNKWHNPPIVDLYFCVAVYLYFCCKASIFWSSPCIQRIIVISSLRLFNKCSWVFLDTLFILHTRRVGIEISTWSVDHVFRYHRKKFRILCWVSQLGRYNVICVD